MKIAGCFLRAVILPGLSITLLTNATVFASDVKLELRGARASLSWAAAMDVPGQGLVWPEFTVSRSRDLVHWEPVPGKLRGLSGRSGPLLNLTLNQQAGSEFFRIIADPSSAAPGELGQGGEEVFGYASALSQELQRLGFMSIEEFAALVPQPLYTPRLSWDPTTAAFWTSFYTNAAFRLNDAEMARFHANGFVVSERLGEQSFGGMYYRIFHGDLPVFVSADSVLQAWHRTYLNMLEEVEEVELSTLAEQVITRMSFQLPWLWELFESGPLRDSILDADYFLTVAQSLWTGWQVSPSIDVAGQQQRVADTLADINSLELREVRMFGTNRWVDFSQFKIRGHYNNSGRLQRYFRMMMWCGRTDLRLATYKPNLEDDIRQLGTAIVLHQLLVDSGQFANWSAIERVTRAFVGVTDSMTFEQMGQLLAEAKIASLEDVPDRVTLTNLQTRLLTGELGVQAITSDKLFSPLSPKELKLPRSFTFFGQKFVLDSWAFSSVVFDKVHWPSDNCLLWCGVTNICGKVVRRKPSCIDVAFSVLGNDQVAPEIIGRIQRTNGEPFRDGLPYQHNLAAVRNVIESQSAETWTENIYTAWLGALRALSAPTIEPAYPEAMRTRAWGMKTLNTQLASWTELRHDTVLYAKQSYTPPVICSYPYGFVEPRPEFWRAMKTLADVAASAIARLPTPLAQVTVEARALDPWGGGASQITCDLAAVKQSQIAALRNFSSTMTTLESIAQKELNQQPLSSEDDDFLISIMEYLGICHQGELGYTGWYPALFYQNVFWSTLGSTNNNDPFHSRQGCSMFDALVADVHTDVPDEYVCDPGAVIHEGVGNVHLLMIAVDNGPDRMVYAGPVFSHYEFEVPGVNRLSDEEWKTKVTSGTKPVSPEWTRSFLAPSGWGNDDMVALPNVASWGANDSGQIDVPGDLTNAVQIGGHGPTGLAVREDGTVVAWGRNAYGETQIPAGLSNVVAVSGMVGVSVAIKSDGTVAAWGSGNVTNVPAGLRKVVAADAAGLCAVAVREDGTVVAWGERATNVPPNLTGIVAVSLGGSHSLALRDNGTVVAWGSVYHDEAIVPAGLSNVVAIAAGTLGHSLALRADGTVAGWGYDGYGQVSMFRGVSNVVGIAAGWYHSAALKADGTVISSAGSYPRLAGAVPPSLSNVVAIAAGDGYGLALVGKAPPVTDVPLLDATFGPEGFSASVETQIGRVYRLECGDSPESGYWQGLRLVAGTGTTLTFTDPGVAGQQRYYRVRRW